MSITKLGDATIGKLCIDAGDPTKSLGLVKGPGVDAKLPKGRLYDDPGEAWSLGLVENPEREAKLTTEPGLLTTLRSRFVFLFARLGFFAGVAMLSSCHFNFTPYPLHVIFSLIQRPQNGFCSSHL
ncbi:hypothetical protein HBI41_084470 [Parastagonospora nodorum]|nr:hypothetical protein HBH71_132200 [Parastagonospora nodorum]KAH6270380.1 hypothetical protein HBI41_084470 [Parastagonospora nodorum]